MKLDICTLCLILAVAFSTQVVFAQNPSGERDGDAAQEQRKELLFAQVKQIQKLKVFTPAAVTKITTLPLEFQGVALQVSRGTGTDTIDHLELANDRDNRVTCVNVMVARDLNINSADIKKSFGSLKASAEKECDTFVKEKFGYKKKVVYSYKKSNVTTEFDVVVKPQERLYSVSLYR